MVPVLINYHSVVSITICCVPLIPRWPCQSSLKESMKLLGNDANSNVQTQEVATMELKHKSVDGMAKCYNLICNLETQLHKMKTGADESDSDDNESSRKSKRMELLEKALSAAYEKLENFSG